MKKFFYSKHFFINFFTIYKFSKKKNFFQKKKLNFSISRNFLKKYFNKKFFFYKKFFFGIHINMYINNIFNRNKYINKKLISKKINLEINILLNKIYFLYK